MGTSKTRIQKAKQLRIRAVLYQDARGRAVERAWYGRKHQPIDLTAQLHSEYPRLAAYVHEHDGWPPSSTRDHRPKLRALDTMFEFAGSLVFLTLDLNHLDGLPLKTPALRTAAERKIKALLHSVAPRAVAYVYAIQRGDQMAHTHAHVVLPLAHLSRSLAELVMAVPAGRGGSGCGLRPGLHGVRMDDEPADRLRVAKYLARDPDGCRSAPDSATYLGAVEDQLLRTQSRGRRLRLSGAVGVVALAKLL